MQGLRKCRAVVCTGKLGALPELLAKRQVEHVVLLTSTGKRFTPHPTPPRPASMGLLLAKLSCGHEIVWAACDKWRREELHGAVSMLC